MESFIAGCMAGAAGALVGHPLDTMKVHEQAASNSKLSLGQLFRGLTGPVAASGAFLSIKLGIYENSRRCGAALAAFSLHWCQGGQCAFRFNPSTAFSQVPYGGRASWSTNTTVYRLPVWDFWRSRHLDSNVPPDTRQSRAATPWWPISRHGGGARAGT